ncbi:phenylacetate--CoA ligase family protein [Pseudomonas neustonica]|uniref:Phenylacetate--CoA ligase family protein n=1 Tax=Pseudomonas neustonica TaxID=2487346 RepID=A0ABX9XDI8_9PSED|nr:MULTISPECIES: phenylacetate--CoA ligase family protein [Pseudomonas]ROZ80434.1 phenylacetate--CoA ligase family protein [Pseudomonas sp. SSM44]ROZ81208.1 phenylacetate--CoA ligase family protein [Pseudomonas neustonica]
MVISKILFIFAHLVAKPRVMWMYYRLLFEERKSMPELLIKQRIAIKRYLIFCKKEVPFFAPKIPKLTDALEVGALQTVINDIPLMTKDDISRCRAKLELPEAKVGAFKVGKTGGSTGDPLKYRVSKKCNDAAFAILYRGLGRGGYKLGDKLAVMAGGSLVTKRNGFKSKVVSFFMNTKKYSSYGVSDDLFQEYYQDLVSWKPKFIRGYASSLFEFAKFIEKNKYDLSFVSVFTTAEMLFEHQRAYIEKVFSAKVYNGYGLNDGGVTAFECKYGGGFHIDLERSFLEVVDESGRLIFDKVGRIVATSFLNKATPFVRYVTGDLGEITNRKCKCGSPYPLLISLAGRTTDVLRLNGRMVGSPVLTVLMGNIDVARYQFIQVEENKVLLVMEKNDAFDVVDEGFIRNSLFSNVGEFDLVFVYDEALFEVVDGGKHKVVINKTGLMQGARN